MMIANNKKIGLLFTNDASFVISQWAIWLSGHVAVPLSVGNHSQAEHAVNAANCSLILSKQEIADKANALCKSKNVPLICLDDSWTSNPKEESNFKTKISGLKLDTCSLMKKAMIIFEPSSHDHHMHGTINKDTSSLNMISINHLQLNRQLDHLVSHGT